MAVKHFTELRAWQLANRLKMEIYRFTGVAPANHDRRFCDDIRASSASVCSNLSEGFGRYTHGEFAQFASIVRGSLAETENHLLDAVDRHYLPAEDARKLSALANEALKSVTALLTYLRTHPTPPLTPASTHKDNQSR